MTWKPTTSTRYVMGMPANRPSRAAHGERRRSPLAPDGSSTHTYVSRLPAAYSDVTAFAVLLLVLFVRPQGLFGSPTGDGVREF